MRFLAVAGVVCLLAAQGGAEEKQIRLKSGAVWPSSMRAVALGHHYILQFRGAPVPELRAELARRGIRVLGPVPDSGLMVSSASAPNLDGLDVTWAGSLSAADKLSPDLARSPRAGYLVIFHQDVPAAAAQSLVWQRGFTILDHPDLLPGHLLVMGAWHRLAELAPRDEVAYIMPASPDLVAGRRVMACAGALTESGPVGEYVEVSPGWPKSADGRVDLNYAFQSLTTKLDENTVRSEMARALGVWARYTNLTFSQSNEASGARTISILFARGPHGDPYPFDGPRGILAHTFYPDPPNGEPIAGDMHLDADEDWQVGGDIDLFSVALHEAGHALGLGHTGNPGSVMYPYYHMLTGLSDDDIAGIRDLYGTVGAASPNSPGAPPVSPPAQPPTQPPVQPPVLPPPTSDQTPPSLLIVSPGSTIVATSSAAITVSGRAADRVGVTVVKWTNSTGESGTAAGTTNWSAQVPLLVGSNVIVIRAFDAAGNSGWRALIVVRR